MSIFAFTDDDALGQVTAVDTATVVIKVADIDRLRKLQVNRLAVLQSSRPGQHLVGTVTRITRSVDDRAPVPQLEEIVSAETNLVRITLIGTLLDRENERTNVFRRTLETVPEIDANCYSLEGDSLTKFMAVISDVVDGGPRLSIGNYTLDDAAEAFINGDKLFQRHAIIVGNTGSGKSCTVARLIEQASNLPNVSAMLFDVHGEYSPLAHDSIRHFRIAGPGDLDQGKGLKDGILYLPYWLLGYEALVSLLVDRSDQNAPNQAMVVSTAIAESKKTYLEDNGHTEYLKNFTVDSPIPFEMGAVASRIDVLDKEMVIGSSGREKQGDFHGKLSRLSARLAAKISDRRLGFMFQPPVEAMSFDWLDDLANALILGSASQSGGRGGIKIINFSEVPSDILPLAISLVSRIVFTVYQWTEASKRHPIALFCDEAHLYIPEAVARDSAGQVSVDVFERIAKEGRKYGVGLVVITQRPSEVNRTVLSQCNNVIAMRLTNGEDQAVVRRLLPDSLGGFGELLPVLDVAEALVVGDASLLPARIRIAEPTTKPNSSTVKFWERWSSTSKQSSGEAIKAWRKQAIERT